jgi:hypothetical protein|tara:strand:+ start:17293 stop:18579 length:1287 start_codon:yes stop_codon:yes gene_type:complete
MATLNQRDIQELFIGADASKSTGGIETLNDGEVGIFTPAGTRLTEALAATTERFILVKGRDGSTAEPVLLSSSIVKSTIVSANANRALWTATAEQVDVIGYDGTSGAIEVINSNLYHVRVNLKQSCTSNIGGVSVKHGIHESAAAAAQWEIAKGLALSLVNDFSKETDRQLSPTRLCDEAGVALGTGVGTITVTNGSKYFLAGTDIDDATTNAAIVVNGFVRFGTATTDPVYQVVAINTTTNVGTLDTAYEGASEVIAEVAVENIPNAAGIAAEWGVRLTGLALPYSVGKINFAVTGWVTTLENMGASSLLSAGAVPGTGNTNQVKDMEFFVQGNEGDYMRMGEPSLYPSRKEVLTGVNYHSIDFSTEEIYTGSIIAGPTRKAFTVVLPAADATDTSAVYALTATTDDITDVLEVLVFGAAGGEFAVG